jgi:hypothetical protein
LGVIIKNVSSSVFCVVPTLRDEIKNVSRTVFVEIFLVLDTIFYRKSLELTKKIQQKLITPNELFLNYLNAGIPVISAPVIKR